MTKEESREIALNALKHALSIALGETQFLTIQEADCIAELYKDFLPESKITAFVGSWMDAYKKEIEEEERAYEDYLDNCEDAEYPEQ